MARAGAVSFQRRVLCSLNSEQNNNLPLGLFGKLVVEHLPRERSVTGKAVLKGPADQVDVLGCVHLHFVVYNKRWSLFVWPKQGHLVTIPDFKLPISILITNKLKWGSKEERGRLIESCLFNDNVNKKLSFFTFSFFLFYTLFFFFYIQSFTLRTLIGLPTFLMFVLLHWGHLCCSMKQKDEKQKHPLCPASFK